MDKMQTIGNRIMEYLNAKGISRNQFCKAKGWDPSKINRQLKGETALSAETIEGFVYTYSDVNLSWLLLGEPPMLLTDPIPEPEPKPAPVAVRADHVAPVLMDPSTNKYSEPAPAPGALSIADAMEVIKSQQQIIERQAAMLEHLVASNLNSK